MRKIEIKDLKVGDVVVFSLFGKPDLRRNMQMTVVEKGQGTLKLIRLFVYINDNTSAHYIGHEDFSFYLNTSSEFFLVE